MAQKVQILLVDDITGEEVTDNGETVTFAVGGASYEIDLNQKNAKKFHETLKFYTDHGRKVGGRNRTTGSGGRTKTDPEQLKAAREWLRNNGHDVSDRGRIKQDLMDLYLASAGK